MAVVTTALGLSLVFLLVSTVDAASVWTSDAGEDTSELAAEVAEDWFRTVPHAVRAAANIAIINNAVNFFNIVITSVWDIQCFV